MFCPKCGTKAIEGADFCQKCGAKLVKDESTKSVPAEVPYANSANTNMAKRENRTVGSAISPAIQEAYDRLTESSEQCPRIKQIAIDKAPNGTSDSVLIIRSIFYKYMYYPCERTGEIRFSWGLRWVLYLIYFPILLCDGLFLQFFFQSEYFLLLSICCLIGSIIWFPFTFLSYKERVEIAAHINHTLGCEIKRPSRVPIAITYILNVVEIGLCIISLVFMFGKSSDAIMDSYTITASNTTVTETEMVDQVLFCGIPIQEVIGMGYDEIISTFGEPNSVYDSNYTTYYEMNYGEAYASDNSDWMIFGLYFEEQNVITAIHASPGLFSFNGQNLRQDYNSLKSIFGEQLELGTTSTYNSESVLYYGDYVYTINYPISPDEWDENALPTDIYVQLFSQSVYNQNSDSGISFDNEMCYIMDGDEDSQIVLYQDGTFSMDVNLYVGGGSLSGSYTCDDYGIHCFVETRNFQGYIGDDVTEFDLTFAEDYWVYRGESIGMTMDGVTFYPYSP